MTPRMSHFVFVWHTHIFTRAHTQSVKWKQMGDTSCCPHIPQVAQCGQTKAAAPMHLTHTCACTIYSMYIQYPVWYYLSLYFLAYLPSTHCIVLVLWKSTFFFAQKLLHHMRHSIRHDQLDAAKLQDECNEKAAFFPAKHKKKEVKKLFWSRCVWEERIEESESAAAREEVLEKPARLFGERNHVFPHLAAPFCMSTQPPGLCVCVCVWDVCVAKHLFCFWWIMIVKLNKVKIMINVAWHFYIVVWQCKLKSDNVNIYIKKNT